MGEPEHLGFDDDGRQHLDCSVSVFQELLGKMSGPADGAQNAECTWRNSLGQRCVSVSAGGRKYVLREKAEA